MIVISVFVNLPFLCFTAPTFLTPLLPDGCGLPFLTASLKIIFECFVQPQQTYRTNWSQEHHKKYRIWWTGCSDNHNPGRSLEYKISESIQKTLLIRRTIVAWTKDPIQNVSLIWLLRDHNPEIGIGICVMFRSKTFLRIVRSRISRIKSK